MKRISLLAALFAVSLAIPTWAQVSIDAPTGWKTQPRKNGATTYTPSDLAAGEIFSVTIYDSAPLGDQSPEQYLRKFAGPVGAGKLSQPLKIQTREHIVTGTGAYAGPNGKGLGAMFFGVSVDEGASIHMARVLFSVGQDNLLDRYAQNRGALFQAMIARAQKEESENRAPRAVKERMKPGGALMPGVYVGNQLRDGQLKYRLRIYIYQNGEYRICDHNDKDLGDRYRATGEVAANERGQITFTPSFDLYNSAFDDGRLFCYFGRNAAGKSVIYAEHNFGNNLVETSLVWSGPPTKRLSPRAEDARLAKIEAEKNRYKFVTAPGKGVKNAQIAAVVHHYQETARDSGLGVNIVDEAFLLLKDGTIHQGLPCPPDQLDVAKSRHNEPEKWGRWTQKAGKYQVAWRGKSFVKLPGVKVLPGAAQARLVGYYSAERAEATYTTHSIATWGVTFDKAGRFSKTRSGSSGDITMSSMGAGPAISSAYDDEGSATGTIGGTLGNIPGNPSTDVSIINRRKNPKADREGTYSINGYTLTLRFDNGQIARMPFFTDAARKTVWFEDSALARN